MQLCSERGLCYYAGHSLDASAVLLIAASLLLLAAALVVAACLWPPRRRLEALGWQLGFAAACERRRRGAWFCFGRK